MRVKPRLLSILYQNADNYPPTFNALAALSDRFDIHLVCRNADKTWRTWPNGVTVERVGPPRAPQEWEGASSRDKAAAYGQFCARVSAAVRKLNPALVLAYDPHGLVAAGLGAPLRPVVYHRHEVEDLENLPLRSFGGWIVKLSLWMSPRAEAVIFPEAERARYYAGFVRDRRPPIIVPNYPSLATFPAFDVEEAVKRRLSSPRAFYRGSIGAGTGAIEAVRALASTKGGIRLRLCGPFNPESFGTKLRNEIDATRTRDSVELSGFVPYDRLNREAIDETLGLVLYRAEGPNCTHLATATNKLFEYAACGLPVLVPNTESFRAALLNEGWVRFVDASSPEAIADSMRSLLSDPGHYAVLCHAARRAFEERFNFERAFAAAKTRILAIAGLAQS